jgi:hypothetical protein
VVPLGEGLSYAQMTHPDGDSQTAVESPSRGGLQIVHRLFAGRLEKGVVLTQRVLAVLIAGPDAASQAAAEHQWFAASPPPLTT